MASPEVGNYEEENGGLAAVASELK